MFSFLGVIVAFGRLWIDLSAVFTADKNITKEFIRDFWEKQSYVMITNETCENNIYDVEQSKIADNEPQKVYLAIK